MKKPPITLLVILSICVLSWYSYERGYEAHRSYVNENGECYEKPDGSSVICGTAYPSYQLPQALMGTHFDNPIEQGRAILEAMGADMNTIHYEK